MNRSNCRVIIPVSILHSVLPLSIRGQRSESPKFVVAADKTTAALIFRPPSCVGRPTISCTVCAISVMAAGFDLERERETHTRARCCSRPRCRLSLLTRLAAKPWCRPRFNCRMLRAPTLLPRCSSSWRLELRRTGGGRILNRHQQPLNRAL